MIQAHLGWFVEIYPFACGMPVLLDCDGGYVCEQLSSNSKILSISELYLRIVTAYSCWHSPRHSDLTKYAFQSLYAHPTYCNYKYIHIEMYK